MIIYDVFEFHLFKKTTFDENALLHNLCKNGSFWKINTTSLILKIYLPNFQGTP